MGESIKKSCFLHFLFVFNSEVFAFSLHELHFPIRPLLLTSILVRRPLRLVVHFCSAI